ncbi:MAG: glycine C-acetyltransferase [Nitrospira sp.]|nr:glycine C-acetyltransferase [Nitrospira sp.]
MAYTSLKQAVEQQLAEIRAAGLFKSEREILSPQGTTIRTAQGEVINLCANNYLGLANHPAIKQAAADGLRDYGYGMASVRFICGTQRLHTQLERALSSFLGTDDTILYSSCFDANGGLFETLLDERDTIISDALNHASLIDGIRLCKAARLRYAHSDMAELEAQLAASASSRVRMIVTDGVFSMDGDLAKLDRITDLADRYDAAVVVDDSHATGVLGKGGRGTPDHCGVAERVDLITSTLGKALGGAAGGFTSGRRALIDLLRQRSRPYLFSNSVPPVIAAAADEHPIIPVMLGEATLATQMADRLLQQGIYVVGFSYPVVPKEQARIRLQLSAAHDRGQLERAVAAFATVGRELQVIR